MINFNEIIYNLEDGDEFFFLPNPYLCTKNNKFENNILENSKPYTINIELLSFKNNDTYVKLINNSLFDQDVFKMLRLYSLKYNNIIHYFKRYYSFIYINNDIKITWFGKKINDMLNDEYLKSYEKNENFNFKKFHVNKSYIQGFPCFDKCFFYQNEFEIPINKTNYENIIYDNNLKEFFNQYYEKIMIQNNLGILHNFIEKNNIVDILNNSHYKKYIRQLKINNILQYDSYE